MVQKIKNILIFVGIVMIFTAQANPPDYKKQQQAQQHGAKPAARPAPAARPQAQTRSQAPRQAVRNAPPVQTHVEQSRPQERAVPQPQVRQMPRVYAVPQAAPVQNNRLLNRQHHNHWQPRYNFYDNQYHFYPYVNIAAMVELTASCVSVVFNGQNYYFDQGTFYLQDETGQYVAVAPPIGIIIPAIPDQARQINFNGQMYFRYKGVCYIQVAQGFQVVEQVGDDPG